MPAFLTVPRYECMNTRAPDGHGRATILKKFTKLLENYTFVSMTVPLIH